MCNKAFWNDEISSYDLFTRQPVQMYEVVS